MLRPRELSESVFRFSLAWCAGLALLAVWGCSSDDAEAGDSQPEAPSPEVGPGSVAASFVRSVEWIGKGHWLRADLHTHTKFSDGSATVAQLTERAAEFGCEAIAITDHAHHRYPSATPEYAGAIEAARNDHPDRVILAGLEWNVPPHGGDEHAVVLMGGGAGEWDTLAALKARHDDWEAEGKPSAAEALRWLAQQAGPGGASPVVLYGHPSRKLQASTDLVAIMKELRSINDLVVGFSGAPGHQESEPIGAYRGNVQLIDRWDPAAARLDDAWDILLRGGDDVWGAAAPSDFHRAKPDRPDDYWPCQFSETWVYVPERSSAGVLAALRAGTFFGVHGHIARNVMLQVDASGLERPATAGEVILVGSGSEVRIELTLKVPVRDWAGEPGRIDEVEAIVIEADSSRVMPLLQVRGAGAARSSSGAAGGSRDAMSPGEERSLSYRAKLIIPGAGLVVRARGRRRLDDKPDLMFYTNPVRILTPSARSD